MIKQHTFTYFPIEKALEKQTKTIESQDEKEIKALEGDRKQLAETATFNGKYSPSLNKCKEIFYKLVAERMGTTQNFNSIIYFENLKYRSHCKCRFKGFHCYNNSF